MSNNLPPNAFDLMSRMTKREYMALEFATTLCRIRWVSAHQSDDHEKDPGKATKAGPSGHYIAISAVFFADLLLNELDEKDDEKEKEPVWYSEEAVRLMSGQLCRSVMGRRRAYTMEDKKRHRRRFISDIPSYAYKVRNNGLPYHKSAQMIR